MRSDTIKHVTEVMQAVKNTLLETVTEGNDWLSQVKDDKGVKAAELAIALYDLKTAYKELDDVLKMYYHIHNQIDKSVLPARLEEQDLDMIRVPEIGRSFSVKDMITASMVDKDKAFEWLRSIGQGDIIQETVNAGTLGSFCRNLLLEQGTEPPEDAVKVNTYKSISINKYTPK